MEVIYRAAKDRRTVSLWRGYTAAVIRFWDCDNLVPRRKESRSFSCLWSFLRSWSRTFS